MVNEIGEHLDTKNINRWINLIHFNCITINIWSLFKWVNLFNPSI